MRITVVTGPCLSIPPAPCGSVERIWDQLASEFVARGHDVTIVCKADPALHGTEHPYRVFTLDGYNRRSSRLANLPPDFLYSFKALLKAPRADILVTNAFWLPVLAGALAPRLGKIHVNVARMPKGQMSLYRLSGVSRLAAVSSAVGEAITRECSKARSLVRVLPNPIDTAVFQPPRSPRLYEGKRTVLFAGRLHPEKGIAEMLKAFRGITQDGGVGDVRLRIVGPYRVEDGGGGWEFVRELRAIADGLPVEFQEPIYDRARLYQEFRDAHYFCYPSLAADGETFGVAALEAMATALPTLTSDLDAFRDFLIPDETGYMFARRPAHLEQELGGAMKEMLTRPVDALSRVAENAVRKAAEYSVASIARQYLADFEALVGGPDGETA